MAEWNYLIYKKQELMRADVPEEELLPLLEEARQHGIAVLEAEGALPEFMARNGIGPEEAVFLAAADSTLQELSGLPAASVGCKSAACPSEGLYGADILAEGFAGVDYCFLERVYQRRHGIPWRVIETERCYLREMALSDLPDLFAFYQSEGMADDVDLLRGGEEEEEYAKAYIAHMYRFYGFGMWLVFDRSTDMLIGRAGLNLLELEGETLLEMGYVIAASRRRMGYAAEVCRAVISYAGDEELCFSQLYCFVRKENHASLALLHKLGFVFCGSCLRDGRVMQKYVRKLASDLV